MTSLESLFVTFNRPIFVTSCWDLKFGHELKVHGINILLRCAARTVGPGPRGSLRKRRTHHMVTRMAPPCCSRNKKASELGSHAIRVTMWLRVRSNARQAVRVLWQGDIGRPSKEADKPMYSRRTLCTSLLEGGYSNFVSRRSSMRGTGIVNSSKGPIHVGHKTSSPKDSADFFLGGLSHTFHHLDSTHEAHRIERRLRTTWDFGLRFLLNRVRPPTPCPSSHSCKAMPSSLGEAAGGSRGRDRCGGEERPKKKRGRKTSSQRPEKRGSGILHQLR